MTRSIASASTACNTARTSATGRSKSRSHGLRLTPSIHIRQTLTIGRFPDVGLAVARKRLEEARALVASGTSPAEAKQRTKIEERLAAKNTLQARAEEWYEAKAPRMSESWRGNARRWLDGDIYPAIGSKPIGNITITDVEGLVKRIAKNRGAKSAFYARLLLADVFRAQPRPFGCSFTRSRANSNSSNCRGPNSIWTAPNGPWERNG
jgi:hypothetical protein